MSNRPSPARDASRPVAIRIESARVRPARRDDLEQMIERLYRRRTLTRLSTWDQMRYGPEIADYLRRRSRLYRTISGAEGTEGPLPFALGFLRVTGDGALASTVEALPDPQPELLVQLLSEFVEPGAQFFFGDGERGWAVEGENQIRAL